MSKAWILPAMLLLWGCANSPPLASDEAPEIGSEPVDGVVLVERSTTYRGMPVTVRVREFRSAPARLSAEVEVVAGTSEWELYAESEPFGKDAFVLIKLFRPGPGTLTVPGPHALTTELPLASRPRRILVRAVLWQKDVHYAVVPQWDEFGALDVPR